LTGLMQSYIIQFERLPAAGTDRCPPRQSAFCVAEPLIYHSITLCSYPSTLYVRKRLNSRYVSVQCEV
jgi:hypothetical protein